MRLQVLGASGGIGTGLRTTSLLVDDDILIDAGTGVWDLALHEMRAIRHIFLTHSHLDHVAGMPLLVDTVFDRLDGPITVHARPETIAAIREHIFNWIIWPDFTKLPSPERPAVRFAPMEPGEVRELDGRRIEMIEVSHSVPAAGYRVECETGAFAFSGDTTSNERFWEALNRHERLDMLIVESAFSDSDEALSRKAGHYCPSLLAADLGKLQHRPRVYLTHLKPGEEELIYAECREHLEELQVQPLRGGQVFQL